MVTLAIGEAVVIFVGIQFIPWGRANINLPVKAEPKWDSPKTRELFLRACGNCHSNQTTLPWYDVVAPITWIIRRDIDKGRAALNVSEWGLQENEAGEAADTVRNGSMPPTLYALLHPSARLSASDKEAFVQGLVATFGSEQKSEQKSKKKVSDSLRFFPVHEDK
ncbi:MAG: heme-binding domain-containing protein [candidate division NC10 bacterium]|nr:heme-binding domain-containing protein [candidate division NC10 bacterium]MDE2485000.1 heme-binding domain-containing protein [candidate division NC10 bacterium]